MPRDTYLVNTVNFDFFDCTCIDIIENGLDSCDFNYIIITGDFNTCFCRHNAHLKC